MSYIFCNVRYGPQYEINNYTYADYEGWAFNTSALRMEYVRGRATGDWLFGKPKDVYMADGARITTICEPPPSTNGTAYFFQRLGNTFTSQAEPNSVYCGYNPPDTRTCTLTIPSVSVTNDRASVTVATYVGPLTYSLDGGRTRQASGEFTELAAGDYTVTVFDAGATLPGCQATKNFTVSYTGDPNLPLASIGTLPAFCWAGNPLILTASAGTPYHYVAIEVYLENAHASNQYTLIYAASKRTNTSGQAQIDVSRILAAQLQPELNMSPGLRRLTAPLRRWFVRVGDVLPQTGGVDRWISSNLSTVVRGGLTPEQRSSGYDFFASVNPGRVFWTWQPTRKQVGPNHREVLQLLQKSSDPWLVSVKSYDAHGAALSNEGYTTANGSANGGLPTRITINPVPIPTVPTAQQVELLQLVLDFSTLPDEAVRVEITASNTQYTTRGLRRYTIRRDLQEPRQLIFENSLAGYDTVAMLGKLSAKLSTERLQVELYEPLSAGQVATTREISWPASATVQSYQLSTGLTTNYWLQYLQELLQPGRRSYEWVAASLRPIVITTKELATYTDGDGSTSAMIEYRGAIKSDYYGDYDRNTNR